MAAPIRFGTAAAKNVMLVAFILAALAAVGPCEAASSSSSSSSKTTPAHGKGGKGSGGKGKGSGGSTCPNALNCGLAPIETVAFLYQYLGSAHYSIQGVVTIGGGDADCALTSVGDLLADLSLTKCSVVTNLSPTIVRSTTSCPLGYLAAIEGDCYAYVIDSEGNALSRLATLNSGTDSAEAYCEINVDGLADGTIVEVNQSVTCSYNILGLDDAAKAPQALGRGSGGGGAAKSGGGRAGRV